MSQRTITIAKAGKKYEAEVLPDVVILIHGEPINPNGGDYAAQYSAFYKAEGERLADALVSSLPGGTLDQLIVRLLHHKASIFRVPLPTTLPVAGPSTEISTETDYEPVETP